MTEFNVGDMVTWTSSSSGTTSTKKGEVVAIVPDGMSPYDTWRKGLCGRELFDMTACNHGTRMGKSYLVAVNQPDKKRGAFKGPRPRKLYWPRTAALHHYTRGGAQGQPTGGAP